MLACVDLLLWFSVFGICVQSILLFTYSLFPYICVEFAGINFNVLLVSCFNTLCVEFAEVDFNVLLASCINISCLECADLTLLCVSSKQFGSLSIATMRGLVVPIALAHAGCILALSLRSRKHLRGAAPPLEPAFSEVSITLRNSLPSGMWVYSAAVQPEFQNVCWTDLRMT